MDIIFAGSPSSSAQILSKLVNSPFNISLVLTQGDKRSSRNKGEEPSEVAKYAKSENLHCFKIDSFCNQTINKISKYPCDILVLSSFGKIIPKEILDHPKITPLNIHFSILPLYRGASPIQSALLNGDIKTGISFMEMVESLDEGPVFEVAEVEISNDDNRISLEKKLVSKAKADIVDVIKRISNGLRPVSQNTDGVSYCRKIIKEDGRIDFNKTAKEIFNKYRAFSGWPGTFFEYKNTTIKVHGINTIETDNDDIPGTILGVRKDGIHIKVNDSAIVITHLQLPGKKIINYTDIYNSYKHFFI
jgi:methionyl-tRNA formyltransferase